MIDDRQMTDERAMDAIHAYLDGAEWSAETIEGVAAYVAATGRVIRGPDEVEAVTDVVAELVDEWGVPEAVARPVVEKFAADGGQGGSDFAGEVSENTAYVVAEWMIHEAMFAGDDGA